MTKIAFAQNYETSFTFQHQPKKNAKNPKTIQNSKSKNNLKTKIQKQFKTQAQKSKNNLKIKPKPIKILTLEFQSLIHYHSKFNTIPCHMLMHMVTILCNKCLHVKTLTITISDHFT